VLLAISPMVALVAVIAWAIVFAISRISSLSAIVAAIAAPIAAWFLLPYKDYVLLIFVMTVFLVWRHKTNIQKLMAGTEAGFKKK
jgi:acyl phosphate:glycerol-3-phosphate acyltransferase